MTRRLTSVVVPMLAAALAGTALAQEVPQRPAGPVQQGVSVPDGNTLTEVLEQQAANKAQADAAKQKVDENDAALAAYAKAQTAYQTELARVEGEKHAIEAQAAEAAADHEAAMAKWRADVAACEEGDKSRCAPKTEN